MLDYCEALGLDFAQVAQAVKELSQGRAAASSDSSS